MTLCVNGEQREVPDGTSLDDLLALLEIPARKGVAVAVNLEVVSHVDRAALMLKGGDRVDVVTAVGGG